MTFHSYFSPHFFLPARALYVDGPASSTESSQVGSERVSDVPVDTESGADIETQLGAVDDQLAQLTGETMTNQELYERSVALIKAKGEVLAELLLSDDALIDLDKSELIDSKGDLIPKRLSEARQQELEAIKNKRAQILSSNQPLQEKAFTRNEPVEKPEAEKTMIASAKPFIPEESTLAEPTPTPEPTPAPAHSEAEKPVPSVVDEPVDENDVDPALEAQPESPPLVEPEQPELVDDKSSLDQVKVGDSKELYHQYYNNLSSEDLVKMYAEAGFDPEDYATEVEAKQAEENGYQKATPKALAVLSKVASSDQEADKQVSNLAEYSEADLEKLSPLQRQIFDALNGGSYLGHITEGLNQTHQDYLGWEGGLWWEVKMGLETPPHSLEFERVQKKGDVAQVLRPIFKLLGVQNTNELIAYFNEVHPPYGEFIEANEIENWPDSMVKAIFTQILENGGKLPTELALSFMRVYPKINPETDLNIPSELEKSKSFRLTTAEAAFNTLVENGAKSVDSEQLIEALVGTEDRPGWQEKQISYYGLEKSPDGKYQENLDTLIASANFGDRGEAQATPSVASASTPSSSEEIEEKSSTSDEVAKTASVADESEPEDRKLARQEPEQADSTIADEPAPKLAAQQEPAEEEDWGEHPLADNSREGNDRLTFVDTGNPLS